MIVTDMTWKSSHEQGTPAATQIYKQPTCLYQVQSSERSQECPLMRPVAKPRENLTVQNSTVHPVLIT